MEEMLQVRFPGGKKVDARIRDRVIQTARELDLATQQELAELTGVSQPRVCRILSRNGSGEDG